MGRLAVTAAAAAAVTAAAAAAVSAAAASSAAGAYAALGAGLSCWGLQQYKQECAGQHMSNKCHTRDVMQEPSPSWD